MSQRLERIIVHWAAAGSPSVDVETLRRGHIQNNGWRDIGYHRVIEHPDHPKYANEKNLTPGMLIKTGRHLDNDLFLESDEIGAHAYGFNRNTIGWCVVAGPGLPAHPLQIAALKLGLAIHWERYNLPKKPETIIGHRDVNPTQCPGDQIYKVIKAFKRDYLAK